MVGHQALRRLLLRRQSPERVADLLAAAIAIASQKLTCVRAVCPSVSGHSQRSGNLSVRLTIWCVDALFDPHNVRSPRCMLGNKCCKRFTAHSTLV